MLSECGCCGAGQELGARQGWAGEGCEECEISATLSKGRPPAPVGPGGWVCEGPVGMGQTGPGGCVQLPF